MQFDDIGRLLRAQRCSRDGDHERHEREEWLDAKHRGTLNRQEDCRQRHIGKARDPRRPTQRGECRVPSQVLDK